MTLAGKRVLVTGGGTGTGADLAQGFAAAGAAVTIAGRRPGPLESVAAQAPGITAEIADVTDEASVAALFDAPPYDIVIANAGAADSAPLTRTSLSMWNEMLAVNLTGTFLTFRAALISGMGPGGRLIAVASIAGLKGAPYVAAYAAAKHGVVGLVRSLAHEVARREITANAICPGFLDTEMTERTLANITARTALSRDEALASILAQNPQRRLVTPAEVTATALWLASPGAAAVNGQAIPLTGGE